MWLAAAIGLASGLGLWHIAIMATAIAVIMLIAVGKMERSVRPDRGD
jgi:putative Mg2+ transporter-C (MgtC) family protein